MKMAAKKYEVLDDSYSDIHGQQVFQSNCRDEASDFYNKYEKIGNQVGVLQWNPVWKLENGRG